jgi:hypothetical protein
MVLVASGDLTFNISCLVYVHKDSLDRVLDSINTPTTCDIARRCRGPQKGNRAPAICENNICTFRPAQVPPPPLDVLTERTLKSISESLSKEEIEVDN